MNKLLQSKYGCWIADGIPFDDKVAALTYASSTRSKVRFYYHDHIWNSFDRNLLGKIPLPQLYKERAQQLRDSYDYLILYYSGGSDSHNILQTFLTNNIKLDEVRVRWSKKLIDGGLYVPNTVDTSARNGVSEWDYCIKPELDKLKQSHPEIKINIIDYTDQVLNYGNSVENLEQMFTGYRWYRGAFGSIVQRLNRDLYRPYGSKGKEGHIFGIEKPMLEISNTSIDLIFIDQFLENAILPADFVENEVECFYWSPDFPLLPMEQAYQVALYIKQKKMIENNMLDKLDYIYINGISPNAFSERYKTNSLMYIQKDILYPHTWNNGKFAAGKPNEARSDWFFWLHESSELEKLRQNYNQAMSNLTEGIDPTFLLKAEGSTMLGFRKTVPFKILDL